MAGLAGEEVRDTPEVVELSEVLRGGRRTVYPGVCGRDMMRVQGALALCLTWHCTVRQLLTGPQPGGG